MDDPRFVRSLVLLISLLGLSCGTFVPPGAYDGGVDDDAPVGGISNFPVDASPEETEELCNAVCAVMIQCEAIPLQECIAGCQDGSQQCSPAERAELTNCADESGCGAFDACMSNVACVQPMGNCNGNAVCEVGEDCGSCPGDCGPCGNCNGNAVCEVGEDCGSCPGDCGPCGSCNENTVCEVGEDCGSCPGDCGPCGCDGDAICEGKENCASCPQDCGSCTDNCGDFSCDATECQSCSSDCGSFDCPLCGDVCSRGPAADVRCGFCEAQVCGNDPFCCDMEWDDACVQGAEALCGVACPKVCGDGTCVTSEVGTCVADCPM